MPIREVHKTEKLYLPLLEKTRPKIVTQPPTLQVKESISYLKKDYLRNPDFFCSLLKLNEKEISQKYLTPL